MYKIATLNKISPAGLNIFDEKYSVIDNLEDATGIMVRSHDMKSMEFSDELLAIARADADTNNIPVDVCANKGIVVYFSSIALRQYREVAAVSDKVEGFVFWQAPILWNTRVRK